MKILSPYSQQILKVTLSNYRLNGLIPIPSKFYVTEQHFSKDGGTHLSGFKSALTRTINNYAAKLNGKTKYEITGDDCREGIVAIISVKMSDPKFSSQTKDKLVSSEIKSLTESTLTTKLSEFLEESPKDAKLIVAKIQQAAMAREEAERLKILSEEKIRLELQTFLVN